MLFAKPSHDVKINSLQRNNDAVEIEMSGESAGILSEG
jgi:hypothetical protein